MLGFDGIVGDDSAGEGNNGVIMLGERFGGEDSGASGCEAGTTEMAGSSSLREDRDESVTVRRSAMANRNGVNIE